MIVETLTHKNYLLYCARYYDNPQCIDVQEFKEDLNRIKYIKKLITRFEQKGELKEQLIYNHILTLYNVFGAAHLPRILYLKMRDQLQYITPYLIALNCLPKTLYNIDGEAVIFKCNCCRKIKKAVR